MHQEVELDIEQPAVVRHAHRRSRESSRRDIKWHVPPVVLNWCKGKSGLADDLHEHVQGLGGILPLGPFEFRPTLAMRHRSVSSQNSV